MLLAGMAVAQVPNGNLDVWKTFGFGPMSINYPDHFLTSNLTVFQGADPSVTEVPGVNGGSAAEIKTHMVDEDGTLTATTGMMLSLSSELSFGGEFENKFPVNGKPIKFEGYYSFAPVQGDTFTMVLVVYQNGNVIGAADLSSNQPVASLTAFSVDVDYFGNDMPDSASITILSSSNQEIHEGTTLTVDELKLVMSGGGSTSIFSDANSFNGQVYPVPASNTLSIRLAETSSQPVQVELFDMSGKLLLTKNIEAYAETAAIDISGLPSGILFGQVSINGQKQSFKATKN